MRSDRRTTSLSPPPGGVGPSRAAKPPRQQAGRIVGLPVTRVTLLTRIKDGSDADAWREFVHLYGPVVYGFARKRGLQDADAADLMQEVLRSVALNAGKMEYDPARGTFRGWLYTVTRNKIYNFLASQRHRPRGSGDPASRERLDAVPDRSDDRDEEWELEYRRRLSARAMATIEHEFQANTWKAFWRVGVEGRSVQEVAAELNMTVGAVYVAKSRVLAHLREEVQRLQAAAEAW
jgi:RNA polymerase sigma factor (sigma-70 family)